MSKNRSSRSGAEIDCAVNRVPLATAGSIPALVKTIRNGTDSEKVAAAARIVELARIESQNEVTSAVLDSGVVYVLVELNCRGTKRQKEIATEALANLGVLDERYKTAIVDAATTRPLKGLEKLEKRKQIRYSARKSLFTPETAALAIMCFAIVIIAWKSMHQ